MPVYEYSCQKCGKTTELLRAMSDADAQVDCSYCGHRRTKRIHSVFSASTSEATKDCPATGQRCSRCINDGECGL